MRNTIRTLTLCKSNEKNIRLIYLTLCIFSYSCEEFVSVPAPSTELVQENVFKDDATALSALAGVYNKMSGSGERSFADGDDQSVPLFTGLYADEFVSYSSISSASPLVEFYFNNVSSQNGIISSTWGSCYNLIYECNRILEGLAASTAVSSSMKSELSGEAKFIRAFCHFYLVNLFGSIPFVNTSDYRVNTAISREAIPLVYERIIADLLDAKNLLSDNYPSAGRVRVNKGAATALLARTYLYAGDFVNAEIQATEVINKASQYKLLKNLNAVFLSNSEEAIWQLLPKGGSQAYTNEGALFILSAPPTRFALRNELYESFESGDLRLVNWIGSYTSTSGLNTWYYPYKYKENFLNDTESEYSMVLRLAEQYLIRAEARAQQNKLTGTNSAETDINEIRNRSGLPNTPAVTKEQLLTAIEQERRVEFFSEWGHRFFDLKRTGRLDQVLQPKKPNWRSCHELLPLPLSELLININLKPQNLCY